MKTLLAGILFLALPAAAQEAPFTWKFQPEPGSKWELRSFITMHSAENVTEPKPKPGETNAATHHVAVDMTQKLTADYNVVSRDDSGAYTIELVYKSFVTDVDMKMDGKAAPPQVQDVMKAATGKIGKALEGVKLTIKLSSKGDVWNIAGLDELRKKILSTAPMGAATAQQFASQLYSRESFKNLIGAGGQLPTSPLSVGQAYSYTLQLPKNEPFAMDIYGTRTLTARQDGKASFDEQGLFDIDTIDIPLDVQKKSNISIKMDGSLKGKTVVDEATGLVAESFITVRYKGTIKMALPAINPMSMPLWASLEQHLVLTPRP